MYKEGEKGDHPSRVGRDSVGQAAAALNVNTRIIIRERERGIFLVSLLFMGERGDGGFLRKGTPL